MGEPCTFVRASGELDLGSIGVDECGKSDYFGPLVVAACHLLPEEVESLGPLPLSGRIPVETCLAFDKQIRKSSRFAVVSIPPDKYNKLAKQLGSIAKMMTWANSQALAAIREKTECPDVFGKELGNKEAVRLLLSGQGFEVNIEDGERVKSQASYTAAGILARAEFVRQSEKLQQPLGEVLPRGANENVVNFASNLVQAHGKGVLSGLAKVHFRTTDKVLKLAVQGQPPPKG
ncbi:MAG: hypothetical protein AB7N10_06015 [Fimbriimonadaceae bacterium]